MTHNERHDIPSWHTKATAYIEHYALNAYHAQKAAHMKRGRKAKTFRYAPDPFHRQFIAALGIRDDHQREEAVKVMMLFPQQFKD